MTSVSIARVHVDESAARRQALPWILTTSMIATTSMVIGVVWDISWHRTIGRDTFWTPAHMAIYLGGLLAGLSGAWLILRTTFGPAALRDHGIRVWGFRGPLGAWICAWGATAMITSAPFDEWWHAAYGLDVKILSPPHSVLGLGMIGMQIGILLLALAYQNRAAEADRVRLGRVFSYTGGAILVMLATILMERTIPNNQHRGSFYMVLAGVFPLFLVAIGRASSLRWPATTACAVYTAISLPMGWILPLFPGRPLLGPIFNPVDHMVPPPFPLLLIVPAVAMDVLLRRVHGRDWLLSIALGAAFVWIAFVVQWWFAEFMLTPHARNGFFNAGRWGYNMRVTADSYQFWRLHEDPVTLRSLGLATLVGIAGSRLGLGWGGWMRRVVR